MTKIFLGVALALALIGIGPMAFGDLSGDPILQLRNEKQDREVAAKLAIRELELRKQFAAIEKTLPAFKKPASVRKKNFFLLGFMQMSDRDSCMESCTARCGDDQHDNDGNNDNNANNGNDGSHENDGNHDGDNGSNNCWDACNRQGWSADHCAQTCGVSNETGSESCWDSCAKQGWSSDHCASTCGTSNDDTKQTCWDQCNKQGWSVDHCAQTCGK